MKKVTNQIGFRVNRFKKACRLLWETSAFGMPSLRIVKCNICNWRGRKFADYDCGFGHVYANAACPQCGSHPRHRSLYFYLQQTVPKNRPLRVLHFAPEQALTTLLRSYANIDYLSVDIDSAYAMQKEDLMALSFKDRSFDVILCIHVLEHVQDDRKAMSEILRVLKADGFAILDVPIDYNRESTYEDLSITSPEARTKAFWQADHVRLYGRDFGKRLEAAGFTVRPDGIINSLDERLIAFHGLQRTPFSLCMRSHRG